MSENKWEKSDMPTSQTLIHIKTCDEALDVRSVVLRLLPQNDWSASRALETLGGLRSSNFPTHKWKYKGAFYHCGEATPALVLEVGGRVSNESDAGSMIRAWVRVVPTADGIKFEVDSEEREHDY